MKTKSKNRLALPESERSALVYLDSASIDATEHVGPRSLPMLEP